MLSRWLRFAAATTVGVALASPFVVAHDLPTNRVMNAFRCRFVGKASPVHFFWGAFDLAVSRFSGRTAPPHPSMPGMAVSRLRRWAIVSGKTVS